MSSPVQISPELSAVPAPARTKARAEAPTTSFADLVDRSDRQTAPDPAPRRNDQRTSDAKPVRQADDGPDDSSPSRPTDDDTTQSDDAPEADKVALPVETPVVPLQQPTAAPVPTTVAAPAETATAAPTAAATGQPTDAPPIAAATTPAAVPPPIVDGTVKAETVAPQAASNPVDASITPNERTIPTPAAASTPNEADEQVAATPKPAAEASEPSSAPTPASTPAGTPAQAPAVPASASGEPEAEAPAALAAASTPVNGPVPDKATAKAIKSKLGEDAPKQVGDKEKTATPGTQAAAPAGPAEPTAVHASTDKKTDDGTPQTADTTAKADDGSNAAAPRHPDAPRAEPQRTDTVRPEPPRLPDPSATTRAPAQAAANATGIQVPVALPHLAVTIASRARGGERQFDIRLDPADLGRIDVKMSIDENGTTTTRISVERSDTLDLMLRDSRSLERALTQAGFKTDDGGLQFNLRSGGEDNAFRQQGSSFANDDARPQQFLIAGTESGTDAGPATPPPALGAALYGRGLPRLGGIDVSV